MRTHGSPDLAALESRIRALETTLTESRQLHQRLCDLLEVVTDVLVPATGPDDAHLREALTRLTRVLGDHQAPGDQRSL